jgi:hypothetical protein
MTIDRQAYGCRIIISTPVDMIDASEAVETMAAVDSFDAVVQRCVPMLYRREQSCMG